MKESTVSSDVTQNTVEPITIGFGSYLSTEKVTRFFLWAIATLVALSLLGNIATYFLPDFPMRDFFADEFALNEEQNFPTLYSSLALCFCALLTFAIARFKSSVSDRYTLYWRALSGIFLYLSVDELISIHEAFSKPMHNLGINGVLHNAWVVPGFVVLGVFFMTFFKFFLHLPNFMKRAIILSIFLFVGGAFIVEIVGGYYKFLNGENNLGYDLITTLEEGMEMLGVVVFIKALLSYIKKSGISQVHVDLNLARKL